MSFGRKQGQAKGDSSVPHTPKHEDVSFSPKEHGKEGTVAQEPGAQGIKRVESNTVYPSGIKLGLLMTSIFIAMFLVSLVRQRTCSV